MIERLVGEGATRMCFLVMAWVVPGVHQKSKKQSGWHSIHTLPPTTHIPCGRPVGRGSSPDKTVPEGRAPRGAQGRPAAPCFPLPLAPPEHTRGQRSSVSRRRRVLARACAMATQPHPLSHSGSPILVTHLHQEAQMVQSKGVRARQQCVPQRLWGLEIGKLRRDERGEIFE